MEEITEIMSTKLSKMIKRLVEAYQLLRIYLFGASGSRRHQAGHWPNTDYDKHKIVWKKLMIEAQRAWGGYNCRAL